MKQAATGETVPSTEIPKTPRKAITGRVRVRKVQDDQRCSADTFRNRQGEAGYRYEGAGIGLLGTTGLYKAMITLPLPGGDQQQKVEWSNIEILPNPRL